VSYGNALREEAMRWLAILGTMTAVDLFCFVVVVGVLVGMIRAWRKEFPKR